MRTYTPFITRKTVNFLQIKFAIQFLSVYTCSCIYFLKLKKKKDGFMSKKTSGENEICFNVSDECMRSLSGVSMVFGQMGERDEIEKNYDKWMEGFLCSGILTCVKSAIYTTLMENPELESESKPDLDKTTKITLGDINHAIEEAVSEFCGLRLKVLTKEIKKTLE